MYKPNRRHGLSQIRCGRTRRYIRDRDRASATLPDAAVAPVASTMLMSLPLPSATMPASSTAKSLRDAETLEWDVLDRLAGEINDSESIVRWLTSDDLYGHAVSRRRERQPTYVVARGRRKIDQIDGAGTVHDCDLRGPPDHRYDEPINSSAKRRAPQFGANGRRRTGRQYPDHPSDSHPRRSQPGECRSGRRSQVRVPSPPCYRGPR